MFYTTISFASPCKTRTEQLTNVTARKGKDSKLTDDKMKLLIKFHCRYSFRAVEAMQADQLRSQSAFSQKNRHDLAERQESFSY